MNEEPINDGGGSEWSEGDSGWKTVDSGRPAPADDSAAGGKATAALIFGIVGLVFLVFNGCCCGVSSGIGLVMSIVALILGIQETRAIENGESGQAGAGMAKAGKILGIIGLALHVLMILVAIVYFVFVIGVQAASQSGSFNNF